MSEKCSAPDCPVNFKPILSSFDDGKTKIVLCPNHALMYVIDIANGETPEISPLPSELSYHPYLCDACGEVHDTVLYLTSNYDEVTLSIHICRTHLHRLVARSLEPAAFKELFAKHGIFHEIHDDFYDDEGNAMQPMDIDL